MDYRRMHHDEIDLPEWDCPRRADPPLRRLVICSTPRSGSYLLCRQMINGGIGRPTEYFREQTVNRLSARWGVAPGDDDAYIDELEARRTTPNGVFAAKVQWHQLSAHPRVRQRLLERADLLVLLFRHDLVAQAVSWQVSLATGYWSFDATQGPRDPNANVTDAGQSLRLAALLHRQNRAWAELLGELRRKVLSVPYEAFVKDQGALLRKLAGDLAIPEGSWSLPPPEGRESGLPEDVETARGRLLALARDAAVAASAGR
jgi:LPS sulfotransferase NodH